MPDCDELAVPVLLELDDPVLLLLGVLVCDDEDELVVDGVAEGGIETRILTDVVVVPASFVAQTLNV